MQKEFNIKGEKFQINLEVKPIKKVYLKVHKEKGITLSCPKQFAGKQMQVFLENNIDWLKKAIKKIDSIPSKVPRPDTGSYFWLLGRKIEVRITKTSGYVGFNFKDDILELHQEEDSEYTIQELIELFLKKNCKYWLVDIYKKTYQKFTDIVRHNGDKVYNIPKLKASSSKRNYASYSKHTHSVNYSITALNLPEYLIEFILFHEFCHIYHINHSKDYYSFFDKVMANHRELDKELLEYTKKIRQEDIYL